MARTKTMASTDDFQANPDYGRAPEELREAGIEVEDIEVVQPHNFMDKAKEAKFMEEKVIIEIDMDDDPNSPVFVYSGHNGVSQWIERGKPQAIKRKYLYSQLMAKTLKWACTFKMGTEGNEINRMNPNARTTYRVHLVRDDNPQGGPKWMQSVMSAANGHSKAM